MKYISVFIALVASFIFSTSAHAQSQFKGSYNLYNGYTQGKFAGYAGYGTATIFANGKVAYTIYYPTNGASGTGVGNVLKNGAFKLSEGSTGNAQLYGNRVAVGKFSNKDGKGFFGLLKK